MLAQCAHTHTHTFWIQNRRFHNGWIHLLQHQTLTHCIRVGVFTIRNKNVKNYVENYANIHRTENEMTTWTQYECESQKKCEIILLYHLQAINTIEV